MGRVGSGRVGSGRVEWGRVRGCLKTYGSGRVGSSQEVLEISWDGSGRVGSGRVGSGGVRKSHETGRVGSDRVRRFLNLAGRDGLPCLHLNRENR